MSSRAISLHVNPNRFWKVVVVYVCGHKGYSTAEQLLDGLQTRFPDVAVIGGVRGLKPVHCVTNTPFTAAHKRDYL